MTETKETNESWEQLVSKAFEILDSKSIPQHGRRIATIDDDGCIQFTEVNDKDFYREWPDA